LIDKREPPVFSVLATSPAREQTAFEERNQRCGTVAQRPWNVASSTYCRSKTVSMDKQNFNQALLAVKA